MKIRGTLQLLIGPVGAGKTTYAQRRIQHAPAVFLDLDSWMVRLFGGDRRPSEGVLPWYLERRDRCRGLLWDTALNVLSCGSDVIVELGLVGRAEREEFYGRVQAEGLSLVVYLLDAPRELRRERVAQRNISPGPFTQVVPPEFFELASDSWEPPLEAERETWKIVDA